eukprot:7096667-Pyramimonas_sp.AAC.1
MTPCSSAAIPVLASLSPSWPWCVQPKPERAASCSCPPTPATTARSRRLPPLSGSRQRFLHTSLGAVAPQRTTSESHARCRHPGSRS